MFEWGHDAVIDIELVSYASQSFGFRVVGATKDGIFDFGVAHDGDRDQENDFFRVTDFPLFVNVHTESTGVELGEFWGILYLRVNGKRIGMLGTGYVSHLSDLSWPLVQSEKEAPRRGKYRTETGSNPSAGAEISVTPDSNTLWILHGIVVTLVTDANAADRRVHFTIHPGGNSNGLHLISPVVQAASLTRRYSIGAYPSMPITDSDDDILVPMPAGIVVFGTTSLKTETENIQVGDDFAAPFLHIEEYLVGP